MKCSYYPDPEEMQVPLERIVAKSLEPFIIFVPHADDESIGAGALLAAAREAKVRVVAVLVSDSSGAQSLERSLSKARKAEFKAACARLGIEEICFWDLVDGKLASYEDLSKRVESIARDEGIELAFAPWPLEAHPDHAALGKAVFEAHKAGAFAGGVYFYEVWSPLPANRIFDATRWWDIKMLALRAHKSALAYGGYERAVEGLGRYRSLFLPSLGREGMGEAYSYLQLRPSLSIREARLEDAPKIEQLFERVFEADMPKGWWSWKYGAQALRGNVAIVGERIVAYYGATARSLANSLEQWCQLGDVMVDPRYRGYGGAKGLFYKMSFDFLSRYVGDAKRFEVGFGFPTPRALRLGERLGLYQRGDRLFSLRVRSAKRRLRWGVFYRKKAARRMKSWAWMEELSFGEGLSGEWVWLDRSEEYWRWRFGEHPKVDYEVLRFWEWGRLYGAAIIRRRNETKEMELLDMLWSRADDFSTLLEDLSAIAARSGLDLTAWGSELAIETIREILEAEVEDAGYMALPGEILGAKRAKDIKGRFWVLGGDTDFR